MAGRPRREPPAFRRAAVESVAELSPRMLEVKLSGPELVGFSVPEPAASIRLLVAKGDPTELVLPTWNGNEFLDADGERPALRTFTPLQVDPDGGHLTVQIVRHGDGAVAGWAERAETGHPVAISGPGRGHEVDADATHHLLVGDETAIPAITQVLAAIPDTATVAVHIETVAQGCELALPDHPGAEEHWTVNASGEPGDTLVEAVHSADIPDFARVWAAGEAAAVQAIRRHLFDERGLPRSAATVRGYWKKR